MKRFSIAVINILLYILLPSAIYSLISIYNKGISILYITVISYIILIIYFLLKYKKILLKDIKSFNKKYILIILKYWIIGFLLMILSNYIINYHIINGSISSNELNNRELLINNKFIYSIMLCLIMPVLEEICFRLEFKKNIKNYKIFLLISSFIFSLMHIVIQTSLIEIIYIVPYFILGFTFSYIYYKTNNIWSNILAHMLHNFVIVIILLINI